MMREIELTKDKIAIVDDEDYSRIMSSGYRWVALQTKSKDQVIWYALGCKNNKQMLMHRFILSAPRGKQVDHIDHDGLNNRRSNIRLANQSQNNANSRLRRNKTTKYRGVYIERDGRAKKFRAQITFKRKVIKLGRYMNPEDAARAYNKAAEEYFGEFATLNDI